MTDFDAVDNVELSFKVGANRFLTVKPFRNELRVDLREWVAPSHPTKKGITFTLARWKQFTYLIDEIDQAATKLWADDPNLEVKKWHLGGNVFVTVNPEYSVVDIRHFWVPEDKTELTATRRGLSLRRYEWGMLKTSLEMVEEAAPDLETTMLCRDTHQNQMGMLECSECSPSTYKEWVNK